MRKAQLVWLMIALVFLELGMTRSLAQGQREAWRQVWEAFDSQYAYFQHKRVDWSAVWQTHASAFDAINDGDAFANQLNTILTQSLHDRHVFVFRPANAGVLGYDPSVTVNYHPTRVLLTDYANPGSYENLNDLGVLIHGWVGQDLAHWVVVTLNDTFTNGVSDEDLENLVETYQTAKGIIIDLRANAGGDETNGRRLLSHFTNEPRIYAHAKVRREGGGHGDFTDDQARTLHPANGIIYEGPVAGLIGQRTMSSAESTALMIRALSNSVLVGDRTRGASANPVAHAIPELDVRYTISTWVASDAELVPFEEIGIQPDIDVPTDNSYSDERDFVLERAMTWIRDGKLDPHGVPPAWAASRELTLSVNSDQDGDGSLDIEEYHAGTDPLDPESVFQVSAFRPGDNTAWQIEWTSVPGMAYRVVTSPKLPFDPSMTWRSRVVLADRNHACTKFTFIPPADQPFVRVETLR